MVKVGMHQGFVLKTFLIDVTKLSRKSLLSELLYADDLVLMGETIRGLRDNKRGCAK